MANLKSVQATNSKLLPVPSANGATAPIVVSGDYVIKAGSASGDIHEMVPWPANTILVDLTVDNQSLGTTFTSDVGVMSGAWGDSGVRTQGAEIMTGKAFGTAGISRADVAGFSRLAASSVDRSIGIKGTTIGTPTVGAAVRVTAWFRPVVEGV
jgi:hypothetical protein